MAGITKMTVTVWISDLIALEMIFLKDVHQVYDYSSKKWDKRESVDYDVVAEGLQLVQNEMALSKRTFK